MWQKVGSMNDLAFGILSFLFGCVIGNYIGIKATKHTIIRDLYVEDGGETYYLKRESK